MSKAVCAGSPIFSLRARASAAAARWMPASRLLTSLALAASPTVALTTKRLAARSASSGCHGASVASGAASIMLMVPARARAGPPEIGPSIVESPYGDSCCAVRRASSGAIVEASSTVRAPEPARATPSEANRT